MIRLSVKERELIARSRLFSDVPAPRLMDMLECLQARRKNYSPGEYVHRTGEQITEVGLVISGQARSYKTDNGEDLLISVVEPGGFLGILLAASRERTSPVDVIAHEELSVVFFPAKNLLTPCKKQCREHSRIIVNFLDSVAEQSLVMTDRISCLLQPSVREKVLSYLWRVAREKGAREGESFSIPLDRNAMARYLNVERSALSRELSRMKAAGLISYRKNVFRLHTGEEDQMQSA